jgi:hypothetical protein
VVVHPKAQIAGLETDETSSLSGPPKFWRGPQALLPAHTRTDKFKFKDFSPGAHDTSLGKGVTI